MTAVWKPGAFAGQTVSREIAGALMSEVKHSRAISVAPHSHEAPYFSLLLEGSYSERASDFSVRYEPYTVVFHDALTEHSDAIDAGGCRMFFVELLSRWSDVVAATRRPAHLFEMHGGTPAWLILRLHREFVSGDAASPLTVESLLFDLCSYLSDAMVDTAREPRWIAHIEEVVLASPSARVDLLDLAREVGVHPAHLCRCFRRFRHRTIGEYVLGLRIQLACRNLTETQDPLSDVAQQSGFVDQSHLTRIFKRVTGMTPGAYRRQRPSQLAIPT